MANRNSAFNHLLLGLIMISLISVCTGCNAQHASVPVTSTPFPPTLEPDLNIRIGIEITTTESYGIGRRIYNDWADIVPIQWVTPEGRSPQYELAIEFSPGLHETCIYTQKGTSEKGSWERVQTNAQLTLIDSRLGISIGSHSIQADIPPACPNQKTDQFDQYVTWPNTIENTIEFEEWLWDTIPTTLTDFPPAPIRVGYPEVQSLDTITFLNSGDIIELARYNYWIGDEAAFGYLTTIFPDMQTVAMVDGPSNLFVGNVTSGKFLDQKVGLFRDTIEAIVVSPNGDSLIVGTSKAGVLIFDLETEKYIPIPDSLLIPVQFLSFSRDGSFLIAGFESGVIQIWDFKDKELRYEIPSLNAFRLLEVYLSIENAKALLLFDDEENFSNILMWDLENETARSLWNGVNIRSYNISENGEKVAVSFNDDKIRIWDLVDGSLKLEFGNETDLHELAFTSDGKLLASSIENGIIIWDITNGIRWQTMQRMPESGRCYKLIFSPNDKILVGVFFEGLFIWDVGTGTLLRMLPSEDYIHDIVFSPSGNLITTFSISHDNRTMRLMRLWGVWP